MGFPFRVFATNETDQRFRTNTVAGRSKSVIDERDAHIRTQIEAHAPNKDSYSLVAKIVNVGVALLVYAKDDAVARHVCDVQTQWTGSGPAYMGNKGAVGIRFRVADRGSKVGEVFTSVCSSIVFHELTQPWVVLSVPTSRPTRHTSNIG